MLPLWNTASKMIESCSELVFLTGKPHAWGLTGAHPKDFWRRASGWSQEPGVERRRLNEQNEQPARGLRVMKVAAPPPSGWPPSARSFQSLLQTLPERKVRFWPFSLLPFFSEGGETLDEIFMWLKKLSLLKFNKKVAAARLVETFGYFKPEVLAKEKQWISGERLIFSHKRSSGSSAGYRICY